MAFIPNHKMHEALDQLTPDDFARVGLPDLRHIPAGLRPFSYSAIVLQQCPMPANYYEVMATFCQQHAIDWTPPTVDPGPAASNIIALPMSEPSPRSNPFEAELAAAYQTIEALRFEVRQLQEAVKMQAMFAEGQAPAVILPGQVVIDLALLREAVADLRQLHHGRNALVELLVNVDATTGQSQMSAADLSRVVGRHSRTSYERLFGKTFAHDGKAIRLQFVAPRATNTPNTLENVAPRATNERSYDMNDDIYKKSSIQEDHSFMATPDATKKPPFDLRPLVYWVANQTGWNWHEWEKIDWAKRSRLEWIALGLHCLEHGDKPGALFASLAKKGQPVQAKFIEAAKRVTLPPAIVIENGVVVQQSA